MDCGEGTRKGKKGTRKEFGLLRVVKYEKVDKIYGQLMGFEGCSVSFVRKT